ncbi:MAG: hypothetical protein H6618_05695 [Deltaproteobacteria bacterium]|nr:hypothetical protein [Deltaproteobacteria bacterium]
MRRSQNRGKDSRKTENPDSLWISVSDMMAGLIFLFLMILLSFSIEYKNEQNAFISAKSELQKPAKTRYRILRDLQKILRENQLEVEALPEQGILRLTEKMLTFPAARAVPESETLANLGKLARALTYVLPCFSKVRETQIMEDLGPRPAWCGELAVSSSYLCPSDRTGSIETVMIEGHTDAMTVRAGTGYRDNLSLSAARATTVLRLLMQCDPRLGRLFNSKDEPLVGASGYSSLRPVIISNPRDPANRRIDIRFVMDLPENALDSVSSINNKKASYGSQGAL